MAKKLNSRQLLRLLRSEEARAIHAQYRNQLDPEAGHLLKNWIALERDLGLLHQTLPPVPQFTPPREEQSVVAKEKKDSGLFATPGWFPRPAAVLEHSAPWYLGAVALFLLALSFFTLQNHQVAVTRGGAPGTDLRLAVVQDNRALVQQLLSDTDIYAVDKTGKTHLFWAASQNAISVMGLLLERNAPVDIADQRGWTPLMVAAHRGHLEAMVLLFQANANPRLKNQNGDSAWSLAKNSKIKARLDAYLQKYPLH